MSELAPPSVDVIVPVLPGEDAAAAIIDALPRDVVRRVLVVKAGVRDQPGTAVAVPAPAPAGEWNHDDAALRGWVETLQVEEEGLGAAVLAGIERLESLAERPAIVVVLPGDGSFDPSDITALLRPIRKSRYDLVIGSPTLGPGHGTARAKLDRIGSSLAVHLIRAVYGSSFSDLSMFFAVRFPALVALGMTDTGAGFPTELRVKALKVGLRVAEVPVTLRRPHGSAPSRGSFASRLDAGSRTLFQIVRNATIR